MLLLGLHDHRLADSNRVHGGSHARADRQPLERLHRLGRQPRKEGRHDFGPVRAQARQGADIGTDRFDHRLKADRGDVFAGEHLRQRSRHPLQASRAIAGGALGLK